MRSHLLRLGVMAALACGVLIALERAALSFGGEKIDPIGEPKGFKAGEPARYAIWAKKGVWHLRTTTAKNLHHFTGNIRVEGGTIDFIQSIHLEEKGKYEDHWRLGPKRHELTFDFKTDRGVDGINFEVSTEAKVIHFNLHIDGKHHAEKIFIGKGNHHPTSDPFNLPAHPVKK